MKRIVKSFLAVFLAGKQTGRAACLSGSRAVIRLSGRVVLNVIGLPAKDGSRPVVSRS